MVHVYHGTMHGSTMGIAIVVFEIICTPHVTRVRTRGRTIGTVCVYEYQSRQWDEGVTREIQNQKGPACHESCSLARRLPLRGFFPLVDGLDFDQTTGAIHAAGTHALKHLQSKCCKLNVFGRVEAHTHTTQLRAILRCSSHRLRLRACRRHHRFARHRATAWAGAREPARLCARSAVPTCQRHTAEVRVKNTQTHRRTRAGAHTHTQTYRHTDTHAHARTHTHPHTTAQGLEAGRDTHANTEHTCDSADSSCCIQSSPPTFCPTALRKLTGSSWSAAGHVALAPTRA
jgi:hypothetical protein